MGKLNEWLPVLDSMKQCSEKHAWNPRSQDQIRFPSISLLHLRVQAILSDTANTFLEHDGASITVTTSHVVIRGWSAISGIGGTQLSSACIG